MLPRINNPVRGAGRRALELLASFPDGCTGSVMHANGVDPKIIAGLTKGGFAKADSPHEGEQGIRLKITEAGRRALAERL
jgi:hypothetical protein